MQFLMGTLGVQVDRDFTRVEGVTTVIVMSWLDVNVGFGFYWDSCL